MGGLALIPSVGKGRQNHGWLTGREGLRPETAAALLRRFGTAEAVYFADEKEFELLQLPGRLCRSLADKSLAGAEHILADCDRLGIFLVTCQDAAYPERLRQLHDYPLVLYGKGKLPRFDEELAIAMVGSRDWAWPRGWTPRP